MTFLLKPTHRNLLDRIILLHLNATLSYRYRYLYADDVHTELVRL